MEEEWDTEGFEPREIKPASKWEDEDADDDVKDNWEDEEDAEEKKDVEKTEEQQSALKSQAARKTKKNLMSKIEEKEREEERRRLELEARKLMTPEEKIAEKLRQQKLQEEADLKTAMDTFGVAGEPSSASGIDAMRPSSKEDFEEFEKALTKRIIPFSNSQHFPDFAEALIRNICVNLPSADLKKLKNTLENLHLEKSKIEKGDKSKKSKGKGKAKLRIEGDSALVNEYSAYADADDYDDFM